MKLIDNNPVSAPGVYNLETLVPGATYTCAIKGNYDGGLVSLSYPDPVTGVDQSVDGGTFDGAGATEFDFVPVTNIMSFTVTGASPYLTIVTARHT